MAKCIHTPPPLWDKKTRTRLGKLSWQTCISYHLDLSLTSFIYLLYQHMSKNLSIFFVFIDFLMSSKSRNIPKYILKFITCFKCYLIIAIITCFKCNLIIAIHKQGRNYPCIAPPKFFFKNILLYICVLILAILFYKITFYFPLTISLSFFLRIMLYSQTFL